MCISSLVPRSRSTIWSFKQDKIFAQCGLGRCLFISAWLGNILWVDVSSPTTSQWKTIREQLFKAHDVFVDYLISFVPIFILDIVHSELHVHTSNLFHNITGSRTELIYVYTKTFSHHIQKNVSKFITNITRSAQLNLSYDIFPICGLRAPKKK